MNVERKDPLVLALIAARKDKNQTQEMTAQAAGISRSALISIESGKDCTLSTLRKLCDVLELEILTRPGNGGQPTLDDVTEENQSQFFPSPQ